MFCIHLFVHLLSLFMAVVILIKNVHHLLKFDQALDEFMGAPEVNAQTIKETTATTVGTCQCGSGFVLKSTREGKFMLACRGYVNSSIYCSDVL